MRAPGLCPSAALAVECEGLFQGNLAALERIAPDLAAALGERVVVVTYLGRARDGAVACRIETADGGRRWVGEGVLPGWAARQMLRTLDLPESGHLFLAPFNGGHTLEALLETTHPHQNVFVLEQDLDLFGATLMTTDLRKAFSSGRVRVFAGAQLARQVARHLREHPWDAPPEHLVTTSTDPETVSFYRGEVLLLERILAGADPDEPGVTRAA